MALSQTIAGSRLARMAALPLRAALVGRHDAQVLAHSARWLATSREHTNFTYDLTPLNFEHLAWWIAAISGCQVAEARSYLAEPAADTTLVSHIHERTVASPRRGLADRVVRFGRRAGWYALVRALRPEHIVETGTDKGLGSCVLAAALLRNGVGRLTTIDVNDDSGYLIAGRYADVTDRVIDDSVRALRTTAPAGLFLHDSLHTFEHETAEYDAVRLTDRGVVLSDNAHSTDALPQWAERTGRRFLFFQERPARHWYPGGGIGAAWDED